MQNIKDLDSEELSQLLAVCDRGRKGYISSSKFIDKLYEFAAETECD
jgi:Ca2+-binding EF-hand superfamily protein